ncbi:MAG: aminotransferase class V-fold PLP-dependent enzyme [Leptonema sp. (in: Bacteria)]|nr:aminotransferase class V-fold PLP-dependent enzyme [Leptonema sp. (in: bacteria)]
MQDRLVLTLFFNSMYLDYNATHPPFIDILESCIHDYIDNYANSSGISYLSQKNQGRIEASRAELCQQLQSFHKAAVEPIDLLFVSTGTEAVYSMIKAFRKKSETEPIVLISAYEHEAMVAASESAGFRIERLPASASGIVDPESVRNRLKNGKLPTLVSVMSICNETGVVQPINEIANIAHEFEIPFVTDSIQATGKYPIDFSLVNAAIVNGHKIGAGYGSAAVYVNHTAKDGTITRFQPIFEGGLQENERRAGTENLPAILALPKAFQRQIENYSKKGLSINRHKKIEEMLKIECEATITAESSKRSNTSYAIFPKMENMDFLLMALDREDILCSTGSSCKSRTRQPSATLLRMGFSQEEAIQALRFSTGYFTTNDEIDDFCDRFPKIYRTCL